VAAEPINIFSQKQDLSGIAALLRKVVPGVRIAGPDDAWEKITIEGTKSWLRKPPTLVFKNGPEYYKGPDWPRQVAGMQDYFSRFPDVARKPDVLRLIGAFRFALATEFEPGLNLQSNDPRLKILYVVTRHLDGVLFTPSGLWDSAGRALLCADGRSDPDAVMPFMAPVAPGDNPEHRVDQEPTPPDAVRVAKRALCLAAVSGRGFLEVEEMPLEQAEGNRKRIMTWIGDLALETELEPTELSFLTQPVGALEQQNTVDAGWRLEAVGVLGWALGRFELPVYDQLVDAGILFPALGFLDVNKATTLLASPKLRPLADLRGLQEQYFALHWSLREFSLRKQTMDFRSFARESWFGPLDVSPARFCEDDLAIGELPIARAPEAAFRTTLSIANERHLAINWLVDGGEVYSATDTST